MTTKIDAQTKLELLKLTVELAKFAVEKQLVTSNKAQILEETFKKCEKLISDSFYQSEAPQNP